MIYLDNASTSAVSKQTASVMNHFLCDEYYNPSSNYEGGAAVRKHLQSARQFIAKVIGAADEELYFTSCATESNAWVFCGGFKNKKGNIVISAGEHASVYESAMTLKNKGTDVRIAPLLKDGTIDLRTLESLIDENTALISVIHCSNETGVINDLCTISNIRMRKCPKALLHSDGVQALGKIPIGVHSLGVDMYSLSAHKVGGAKGVGAIFIKKGLKLAPLLPGGGQENGMRSGTENCAGIMGFAASLNEYVNNYALEKIGLLKEMVINALVSFGGIVNGANGSPHILSISFPSLKAEIIQSLAAKKGVLIGLGSACSGKSKQNRVLSAMGVGQKAIEGTIRISFGIGNSLNEVKSALSILSEIILTMRGNNIG